MRSLLISAAAGVVAGGVLFGGAVGVIQQARIEREMAAHAETKQEYADARADAARQIIERQAAHQAAVAALDNHYTKGLTDAYAEIARLRADVAAGRRLRVNAECPAPGVPAATVAAGVDDATGPRLTGAAERDYFALRERIVQADAMIKGLQEYVREVCLMPLR